MPKGIGVVLLAVLVVAGGCGGGGSSSPEEEVRAVSIDFVEALIDGNNGEACGMTTDAGACLGALALAEGFLGEGGYEGLLPDDWREQMEELPVEFSDDTHATMPGLTSDEEPTQFVYEDGEWRIVFEEDTSVGGGASGGSGGAAVSAETAEGWAEKWCQVQLGMTLSEADEIMGEPTSVFGEEQHQWEAFEWHFTAFANSDGTIRQLDSTEEGSTPETSSVECGTPVIGVPEAKTRQ